MDLEMLPGTPITKEKMVPIPKRVPVMEQFQKAKFSKNSSKTNLCF
jgi:hypothetical protein